MPCNRDSLATSRRLEICFTQQHRVPEPTTRLVQYRHMPVRGEGQDKKDIAIFTMASLSFGQVPAVYHGSVAVQYSNTHLE